MTFNARFVANIIQFAVQQGAQKSTLLDLTGYSMVELNHPDLQLDGTTYNRVLEEIVKQTQNDCFGLHFGDALSLASGGLLLQIIQVSQNVEEAFKHLIQYASLGCRALPFSLNTKDQTTLSLVPNPLWQEQSPVAVTQTVEAILVFTVKTIRSLIRENYAPQSVRLSTPKPKETRYYELAFRSPVQFDQPIYQIVLDQSLLNKPIITSDYQLLELLLQHANQRVATLAHKEDFKTVIKRQIIQLLDPGFPSLEKVAATLHLSTRSLQRKLNQEKITFKAILDELRQEFAIDYLKKPHLTIKEIAYLLNYSDSSAFNRSFKRWTGHAPANYRKEVLT